MEQPVVNDSWSDQVNNLGTCENGSTNGNGVNMNESRTGLATAYAIKWGEKIEITDDLIAQICPADLANYVCEFDYVMPNGCDHSCEMLRLCEVYVTHCGYECPNTDGDNLKCPYVHGVPISCSSVNRQYTIHLEKKPLDESLGTSSRPTAAELKKEERSKKKGKPANNRFTCSFKVNGDCQRGHDHQAARLASYAMLPKHQHAGRIVHGIETVTFDEKMAREVELLQGTQLNTMSGKDAPLPAGATSTLVVQSLAYATTEEDLKAAFEKYGDVKRVKILTKDDGSSKGTGFVNFAKPEHAAKGLNAMQGIELNGRALKVKFREDRGDGQSKGGGSRACFSCGQEGHISRNCPSKDSSQGGGSGTNDNSQVQTVGNGWDTTGGKTAGGHEWASGGGGGGDIATQELTNGWGNAGNDATANSSGW